MFLVMQDNCTVISSDCLCKIFVKDCSIYADVGANYLYVLAKFSTDVEAQAEFDNILGAIAHPAQYPISRVGGSNNG